MKKLVTSLPYSAIHKLASRVSIQIFGASFLNMKASLRIVRYFMGVSSIPDETNKQQAKIIETI